MGILKSPLLGAWIVILSGVVVALQIGKLPPALPALQDQMGVTWLQAGFLLSMVQFAGMALGLVVGLFADRWGLRLCMLCGLVALSVASFLGGLASAPEALLWLRGMEGFGFLLASLPAPALIRQLVPPDKLNAMMGLWGAYMPAGTALALLVGPLWIPVWGWPSWWWLFAGLSALMALGLLVAVPADSLRCTSASTERANASSDLRYSLGQRIQETLRTPGPWLVSLTFAMYSGQWLAVVGFLPTIYAQAGLSGAWLGVLTALAAAVNMVGNVASGRLLQKGVSAGVLLYCGFFAMALGGALAFGVWTSDLPIWRYAGVLLFSMCGGLVPGTLFSLALRLAPSEGTVAATVGWMQQWSSAGQFVGPPAVAWLAAQVGGWQWTWTITGACCVVGMLLSWRMAVVMQLSEPHLPNKLTASSSAKP
jgi:MFS family permease